MTFAERQKKIAELNDFQKELEAELEKAENGEKKIYLNFAITECIELSQTLQMINDLQD